MFTLTTDQADRRFDVHPSGYFSVPKVDDLRRQLQSLVRSMGWDGM